MKKSAYIISAIVFSLFLFGCSFSGRDDNGGGSGNDNEKKISEYYPIRENTRYVYAGDGNEYASYEVFTDYTLENRAQYRKTTGGTVVSEVYEVDEEKVTKLYSRGEAYYREDYLRNDSLIRNGTSEVILKAPIEVGNSWTLDDGAERSITGVDVEVEVPYGSFKAVEVTTDTGEFETADYYVKDIGHVKSVFKSEGHEISSSLEEIEENAKLVQRINFYYPNIDESKYYFKLSEISFETNDITRKKIESVYRENSGLNLSDYGLGRVLTENAEINYLYLGENDLAYIDLNQAFVDDMNAGAAYENMVLQSLANTVGQYYGAGRVKITIEGENYESGHISLGDDEYLEVSYEAGEQID